MRALPNWVGSLGSLGSVALVRWRFGWVRAVGRGEAAGEVARPRARDGGQDRVVTGQLPDEFVASSRREATRPGNNVNDCNAWVWPVGAWGWV